MLDTVVKFVTSTATQVKVGCLKRVDLGSIQTTVNCGSFQAAVSLMPRPHHHMGSGHETRQPWNGLHIYTSCISRLIWPLTCLTALCITRIAEIPVDNYIIGVYALWNWYTHVCYTHTHTHTHSLPNLSDIVTHTYYYAITSLDKTVHIQTWPGTYQKNPTQTIGLV